MTTTRQSFVAALLDPGYLTQSSKTDMALSTAASTSRLSDSGPRVISLYGLRLVNHPDLPDGSRLTRNTLADALAGNPLRLPAVHEGRSKFFTLTIRDVQAEEFARLLTSVDTKAFLLEQGRGFWRLFGLYEEPVWWHRAHRDGWELARAFKLIPNVYPKFRSIHPVLAYATAGYPISLETFQRADLLDVLEAVKPRR